MTAQLSDMHISLGPCQYNWNANDWRDFYFNMADEAAIDTVYLGEVVCQKRWPFFEPVFADVVGRLERAGKEVVLSTLTLIMSEQDKDLVAAIAGDEERLIEVNDLATLEYLSDRKFAIGPMVNVYNEGTLSFLSEIGAVRVCLPVELPIQSISALANSGSEIAIEVQAFGRIPLAISARCYHARSRGLHKSGCQYVCGEDPNGMSVETLERQSFLSVNGTQTQSHRLYNLIRDLPNLKSAGVSRLRLYPHKVDMVKIVDIFRKTADNIYSADDAQQQMNLTLGPCEFSNGFLHNHQGLDYVRD